MYIDESTALNFFSAYSQAVAALVGLSASFAIFKYQSLRNYFTEKVEKIYEAFNTDFWDILTEDERVRFKDFVNHEQRATFVEPIYRRASHPERKHEVRQTFSHASDKIHKFETWTDEFNDYTDTKNQMNSFRHRFLISTAVGLSCVLIGLGGILTAPIKSLEGDLISFVIVAFAILITYLFMLYRLLAQAFRKAE